jgi:OmpA-OmpF porin, OOP family
MTAVRSLLSLVLASAAAFYLPPASSQTEPGSRNPASTPIGTGLASGRGYLGLSLGRSSYSVSCGITALACDDKDRAVRLYAGTMVGNFWGVELGYLDMGRMARGGGDTRARGLNLSLVGKAPLPRSFGVFGRIGTTYGRTETSALAGSGIATGTERGFGLSYGAGLSYEFTPRLSATVEWESNDFRFAGGGRDPVRSTSLGLQYRY